MPWDEEATLTWQPRVHVTGTIRNDSGAPITQLSIDQFIPGGEQAHFTDARFEVPHGASRRFTWKSAAPGAGSLLVTCRGATRSAVIDVPDHASGPTDLGVIAFGPPARIRFTGADGATTRVFVCAWDPATGSVLVDGGLPVWVVCDADAGWISKRPLAPGRRRLLVLAAGRLAADVGDVELAGAPVTDVGVRLARPADVVVHARDADRVVSGASVVVAPVDPPPLFETLRTLSGMWARSILDATRTRLTGVALHRFSGPGMDLATTTDAAGRAWVTRLPAGRLRITVTAPDGGASREVIVELVEGETTDVDVDLAR